MAIHHNSGPSGGTSLPVHHVGALQFQPTLARSIQIYGPNPINARVINFSLALSQQIGRKPGNLRKQSMIKGYATKVFRWNGGFRISKSKQ